MSENENYDLVVSFLIKSNNDLSSDKNPLSSASFHAVKKGDVLSKTIGLVAPKYIWEIREKYACEGDIEGCIASFFSKHGITMKECMYLPGVDERSIRLSFISEWAMFGFSLSPNELKLLQALDVPIEFSVFSWGHVQED